MSTFTPAEMAACRRLIAMALEEDLGDRGDVTSQAIIPDDLDGRAVFVARGPGVLSGLPACRLVTETIDSRLKFTPEKEDGDRVSKGDSIAVVSGRMRSILASERTALNFLQHLSGVATLTRQFVDAIAGLRAKILDTRKTLPGWRVLDKYAVRCGGGQNHRMGLYDGILVKDNHLFAMGWKQESNDLDDWSEMRQWWDQEKSRGGLSGFQIEIEVESISEFREWLDRTPAIILLDNLIPDLLREAVRLRDKRQPKVLLEASGGVNLQNVRAIAETGVDRISVGAITHSAPALDIALDYEHAG